MNMIKKQIDSTKKEVIKNTYKEASKNMIVKAINKFNKKYIRVMKKLAKY